MSDSHDAEPARATEHFEACERPGGCGADAWIIDGVVNRWTGAHMFIHIHWDTDGRGMPEGENTEAYRLWEEPPFAPKTRVGLRADSTCRFLLDYETNDRLRLRSPARLPEPDPYRQQPALASPVAHQKCS